MDANACAVGDEQKHSVVKTTTTGDPHPSSSFDSEDEGSFSQQQQQQMESGRRDARVVCETTGRYHHFSNGSAANSRHNNSDHMNQKWRRPRSHHLKRRAAFAYSHSRNPLLVCFIGESVLSQRSIRLHPNSDSANSQKAASFFTLIPVDNSRINEKTGEPSSPQLSCIGKVKCSRQAKACSALAQDMAQLELSCDRSKFGTTRRSCNRARSYDFAAAAMADIPHLDLNDGTAAPDAGPDCPRLMRSVKRPSSLDFSSLTKEQATRTDPMAKQHSNHNLNQLLKQLLRFRSLFRFSSGFICGWNSRDNVMRDGDEVCSREKDIDERRGSIGEHYEIDLSRFASCDMQLEANTPSFLETRGQIHGKNSKLLADIHVSQALAADLVAHNDGGPLEEKLGQEVPEDERFSSCEEKQEFTVPGHPTFVIKVQGRRSCTEATLWKRRSMDRPLTLEVRK